MKHRPLLPLFLTVFIDLIGIGIAFPTTAIVFFGKTASILPVGTPDVTRNILYGLLLATFPLAQFFGSPILGALSDRHGRKPILILSLLGTMIGYVLFGVGILTGQLWLLFVSRTIDGFTGGNISIAMSSIADLSDEKSKARNFGLIGMAFGLGFILGPFIGGKLSDPTLVSWFTLATPYWFAVLLTVLNIALFIFIFDETLKTRRQTPVSVLTGFKNIAHAFQMKRLRVIFSVIFLLTLGFNFFTQFFQVYMIHQFHYNQSQIGDIFAYIGLWIAVTQGLVTRWLSHRYKPEQILPVTLVCLALSLLALFLPTKAWMMYLIMPFIAVFQGVNQPNSTAVVSNLSDAASQGEILGINQSIQSLGMVFPPLIGGFVASINYLTPIMVGSGLTFAAWLVFIAFYHGKSDEHFHEV